MKNENLNSKNTTENDIKNSSGGKNFFTKKIAGSIAFLFLLQSSDIINTNAYSNDDGPNFTQKIKNFTNNLLGESLSDKAKTLTKVATVGILAVVGGSIITKKIKDIIERLYLTNNNFKEFEEMLDKEMENVMEPFEFLIVERPAVDFIFNNHDIIFDNSIIGRHYHIPPDQIDKSIKELEHKINEAGDGFLILKDSFVLELKNIFRQLYNDYSYYNANFKRGSEFIKNEFNKKLKEKNLKMKKKLNDIIEGIERKIYELYIEKNLKKVIDSVNDYEYQQQFNTKKHNYLASEGCSTDDPNSKPFWDYLKINKQQNKQNNTCYYPYKPYSSFYRDIIIKDIPIIFKDDEKCTEFAAKVDAATKKLKNNIHYS